MATYSVKRSAPSRASSVIAGVPSIVYGILGLALFVLVCEAVQHAHHKGVIHRDLKPDNIFLALDEEGRERVKLLDFGIAKAGRGQMEDTGSGQLKGKVPYTESRAGAGREC